MRLRVNGFRNYGVMVLDIVDKLTGMRKIKRLCYPLQIKTYRNLQLLAINGLSVAVKVLEKLKKFKRARKPMRINNLRFWQAIRSADSEETSRLTGNGR